MHSIKSLLVIQIRVTMGFISPVNVFWWAWSKWPETIFLIPGNVQIKDLVVHSEQTNMNTIVTAHIIALAHTYKKPSLGCCEATLLMTQWNPLYSKPFSIPSKPENILEWIVMITGCDGLQKVYWKRNCKRNTQCLKSVFTREYFAVKILHKYVSQALAWNSVNTTK